MSVSAGSVPSSATIRSSRARVVPARSHDRQGDLRPPAGLSYGQGGRVGPIRVRRVDLGIRAGAATRVTGDAGEVGENERAQHVRGRRLGQAGQLPDIRPGQRAASEQVGEDGAGVHGAEQFR